MYHFTEDRVDPANLSAWTNTFWRKIGNAKWSYYLGPIDGFTGSEKIPEPLLHLEMRYAEDQKNLPRLDERTISLALLVGDRFEPLLQTIWAYAPHRLVAVVNEFYGDRDVTSRGHIPGKSHWRGLRDLIKRLPSERIANLRNLVDETQLKTVSDNPAAVFDHLRQQLQPDVMDPSKRVVVDITGAKKTMVAGAYLFASLTDCEVSYVDFDRYDKEYGPYGYTCRISRVANPFEEWGLRYWERAAQLYGQYDFGGALDALPAHLWDGASPDLELGLDHLRTFLTLCSEWENSDLRSAQNHSTRLPIELRPEVPMAVDELYQFWPELTKEPAHWVSAEFLCTPRALMLYAEDELERARRFAGKSVQADARRDYRAAFTRAYALHETLIKARAVTAFVRNQVGVRLPGTSTAKRHTEMNEAERVAALDRLHNAMLTTQTVFLLRQATKDKPAKTVGGEQARFWRIPNTQAPILPEFQESESLRIKRNLITHTYIPVSESDADQAIELAKANIADYRDNWAKWIDRTFDPKEQFKTRVPEWQMLLTTCKLDFIPRSRRAEMEAK